MSVGKTPQHVAMWVALILLLGYLVLALFDLVPKGREVVAPQAAEAGYLPPPSSLPTVRGPDGSAPDLLPALPEDSELRRPRPEPGREDDPNAEVLLDGVVM